MKFQRMLQQAGHAVQDCARSLITPPYSKIFFVRESSNWSLTWDVKEVRSLAHQLGYETELTDGYGTFRQAVFYPSKYAVANRLRMRGGQQVFMPLYHGYPDSCEVEQRPYFDAIVRRSKEIFRIQVSHKRMENCLLDAGVAQERIMRIPIGVNQTFFSPVDDSKRDAARKKFGLPESAVVVGSFQKDGQGMGEGVSPKMIKGPDVFLQTMRILQERVPELYVLLSGPARGYVRKGLEELRVPYVHTYLEDYSTIGELYHCLDAYVVSSREEGGPKAVLESMCSGVPIISTAVGQAVDLIEPGRNGFLCDVEDAEGLAHYTLKALEAERKQMLVEGGLKTAALHTYTSQLPLWDAFFSGGRLAVGSR